MPSLSPQGKGRRWPPFCFLPVPPLRRPRGLHGGGAAALPRPPPGCGAAGRPGGGGCEAAAPSLGGWLPSRAAVAPCGSRRDAGHPAAGGPAGAGSLRGSRQPQVLCGSGLMRQGNCSAREISTALKGITSSLQHPLWQRKRRLMSPGIKLWFTR